MQNRQDILDQIKREWAKLDNLKLEDFTTEKDIDLRDSEVLGRALALVITNTSVSAAQNDGIDLGNPKLIPAESSSSEKNQQYNMYSTLVDGYEALMRQLIELQEYNLIVRLTTSTCKNNPEVEDILVTATNLLLESDSITNARLISAFDFTQEGPRIDILIAIAHTTGRCDDAEKARDTILRLKDSLGKVIYLANLYAVTRSNTDQDLATSMASALEVKDQIFAFCSIAKAAHSLTGYAAAIDACFAMDQDDQKEQLRFIVNMIFLDPNVETKDHLGQSRIPKSLIDSIKHPEMHQKVRQQFRLN